MLSLLFCGMLTQGAPPAVDTTFHWLSYFAQAYELLVINEFRTNPADFVFTAAASSLPPLRVTGRFILRQFGFESRNFYWDLAAMGATAAACLLATYGCLLLSHPDWRMAVSTAVMGPHRHSRRRALFRAVVAATMGDASVELYDPSDFPEVRPAPPGGFVLLPASFALQSVLTACDLVCAGEGPRTARAGAARGALAARLLSL